MREEIEVQITEKREIFFCDQCGMNVDYIKPESVKLGFGDHLFDFDSKKCVDAFARKVLALRTKPIE